VFEKFHSIKRKPLKFIQTDCARCDNRAPVHRRIGIGAGVIFKGSGFYETDYRSEQYKKDAKAEQEAATGKKDGGDKSADKSSAGTGSESASTGKNQTKKSDSKKKEA